MEPMDVATTIRQQLGGNRFTLMTGAKHFSAHAAGKGVRGALSFRLPSRFAKDGINYVKITLTSLDTYTIDFIKIGPQPSLKQMMAGKVQSLTTVATREDVYADQLQAVFTHHTGLDTHL